MKHIVITFALGATISNKDGTIDLKAISSIGRQFRALVESLQRVQIVAVVGAGGLGRSYVQFARDQFPSDNKTQNALDSIAICASRVNALLLSSSIMRSFSLVTNARIPENMDELDRYLFSGFQCVVLGGLEPGMTSDSTAARIAQGKKGPLVIVSSAGGIYREKDGELQSVVDRSYLRKVISLRRSRGGFEHVLDQKTAEILLEKKSKGMKVIVTGYSNIFDSTQKLLSKKKGKSAIIEGTTIKV
jgi:uridylate kinase